MIIFLIDFVVIRFTRLSDYLKHIIDLLGVVGRFLEILIFEMAVLGLADKNNDYVLGDTFYYEGLCYFLEHCQDEPTNCQKLLDRTVYMINTKFPSYFNSFTTRINIVPELLAYSLFDWDVDRKTLLGKKKPTEEQYTVGVRLFRILCVHVS